jgi:hypothetical protein
MAPQPWRRAWRKHYTRGVRTNVALGAALFVLGAATQPRADELRVARSQWSASPIPVDAMTLAPLERQVLSVCGVGDAGLFTTALAVLKRTLGGQAIPEPDEIATAQRATGEPHPWARAWVARGRAFDATWLGNLGAWLGPVDPRAQRRCGVASGSAPDGAREVAVVVVDALADLQPLPTRARPGQWLNVEARLWSHANGAAVVVVGPSGPPQTLLSSFDGVTLKARFAPDRPGEFAIQVLADVVGGPRPVLEAIVFAGIEPLREQDRSAPGEDAAEGVPNDEEALARMIGGARTSVGLAPLARDSGLDVVARDHAIRMSQAHQLAHDVGDGDPTERLRLAGVDPRVSGENVAHAPTLAGAHRALWASPSHRSNLLRREFRLVGVGVVRDTRGEVWVVETFADAR